MNQAPPSTQIRRQVRGENHRGPLFGCTGVLAGGFGKAFRGFPPLSLLSHLARIRSPAYMPLGLRQPRSCRSVRTSVRSNHGNTFQTRRFHSRVGCHPHTGMGMSSSCHFCGRPRSVPTRLHVQRRPMRPLSPALRAPVFAGLPATSFPLQPTPKTNTDESFAAMIAALIP